MKRIAFVLSAAGLVALAACDRPRNDVPPASNGTTPAPTDTGGPCGDGRILRPGEQCP